MLANALCVIWCGRVFFFFSEGLVVDIQWASGGQWVCCCEWDSVRNKVVLVWVESGSTLLV